MKKIPMSESVGLLRLTLIVCALVAQLVVLALFHRVCDCRGDQVSSRAGWYA